MTLGEIIAEYRHEHKLTQREFARMCDVSNGYISMIERGINPNTDDKIVPTIPMLKKLSKQMGLTLDELMSQADDLEVDLTLDYAAVSEIKTKPTDKEITYDWIENHASREELIDLMTAIAKRL